MSLTRGFLSGLFLPQALNVFSIYMRYWGGEISLRWVQFDLLATSGEASPTFGHANANFSVFIDHIRNQFLKK